MRLSKTVWSYLLASASFGMTLGAQQLHLADLPGFRRELIGSLGNSTALVSSDTVDLSIYNSIDPERSLLIHDCSDWCEAPDLSFGHIFSSALQIAAPGADSTDALKRWIKSASAIPGFTQNVSIRWLEPRLKSAPFQLLAVVNRMDAAQWDADSKCWRGAEFRLVYGSTALKSDGSPADFTLIIEFVFKAIKSPDFKKLAQSWLELSNLQSRQLSQAVPHLASMLLQSPMSIVRIRTNSKLMGGARWTLGQWQFSREMLPTKLDGQIRDECVLSNQDCPKYTAIWDQIAATDSKPLTWPIDPDLEPNMTPPFGYAPQLFAAAAIHSALPEGMPTPKGVQNPDPAARDLLSLQQCSFCHSSETGTEFMHVVNRRAGSKVAALSGFLRGFGPEQATIRPTIEKLKQKDPQVVFTARVQYGKFDSSGSRTTQIESRSFHDLGRRMIFLAAILSEGEPSAGVNDAVQIPLATSFSAIFAH